MLCTVSRTALPSRALDRFRRCLGVLLVTALLPAVGASDLAVDEHRRESHRIRLALPHTTNQTNMPSLQSTEDGPSWSATEHLVKCRSDSIFACRGLPILLEEQSQFWTKTRSRKVGELGGMTFRLSPLFGLHQVETRTSINEITSEFRAKLVPDRALENCYAVLVAFERDFLINYYRKPQSGIAFSEIGTVSPDNEISISIRIPGLERGTLSSFFILLFSNGQEIQTTDTPLASLFFDRLDRLNHRNAVKRHTIENPSANMIAS